MINHFHLTKLDFTSTMTCTTAISASSSSSSSSSSSMKALNQLICLVSGREIAIATSDLMNEPDERIGECFLLAIDELNVAVQSNNMKAMKQCQRKMESLNSLRVLSSLINT